MTNLKGWHSLASVLHQGKTSDEELEEPKRLKQWKPVVLRDWSLLLILFVTVGLIGGIITLMVLSRVRHGFVEVRDWTGNLAGIDLGISLVWVVVPSFVFGVYGQVVAAAIDAFGFRQPFVELWWGAPAAKTIALDYNLLLPGQRELTAIRNRHWHLVVPFIFSLLLKTAVGPLAARMMVEQPYAGPEPVTLYHEYALTSTTSLTESLDWDLLPVFEHCSCHQSV